MFGWISHDATNDPQYSCCVVLVFASFLMDDILFLYIFFSIIILTTVTFQEHRLCKDMFSFNQSDSLNEG